MKKFLCGITAVLMAFAMTSCEDKTEDSSSESGVNMVSGAGSGVNLKQDDMPYGSTVFELSQDNDDHVKYITCFDKRYFGGDDEENPDYSEIYVIHDYVASLNDNDHDLMKSVYYDGYLEEACRNGDYEDVDEYIDGLYETLVTLLGDGFEIDYIDVSACIGDENVAAVDYMATVDEYLTNIGAIDKVTSKKVIEVGGYTCYSGADGGSYQLTNHMESIILGVYIIDGQAYIV
ncbi:MAG: hypothetical protein NC340_01040 [Ruminococcus flavefaciens]|nr:hypothetical protein [Ruminococcus flavefaciens]MCM1228731.1 hypothetical protein [Ruminococcus flavefaciens]